MSHDELLLADWRLAQQRRTHVYDEADSGQASVIWHRFSSGKVLTARLRARAHLMLISVQSDRYASQSRLFEARGRSHWFTVPLATPTGGQTVHFSRLSVKSCLCR